MKVALEIEVSSAQENILTLISKGVQSENLFAEKSAFLGLEKAGLIRAERGGAVIRTYILTDLGEQAFRKITEREEDVAHKDNTTG